MQIVNCNGIVADPHCLRNCDDLLTENLLDCGFEVEIVNSGSVNGDRLTYNVFCKPLSKRISQ